MVKFKGKFKTQAQFVNERNVALFSMNVDEFREFYQKYRRVKRYTKLLPRSDEAVMRVMCEAILELDNAPVEKREAAAKWLNDHKRKKEEPL